MGTKTQKGNVKVKSLIKKDNRIENKSTFQKYSPVQEERKTKSESKFVYDTEA